MKRHSATNVLRKLKMKTRYHCTPVGMAQIWNTENIKYWWVCRATGTLIHLWWECKMIQPLCNTVQQCLVKPNILLPWNPAIILLGTLSGRVIKAAAVFPASPGLAPLLWRWTWKGGPHSLCFSGRTASLPAQGGKKFSASRKAVDALSWSP